MLAWFPRKWGPVLLLLTATVQFHAIYFRNN